MASSSSSIQLTPARLLNATLSIAAVLVLLASYETAKTVIKRKLRKSHRRSSISTAPKTVELREEEEELDDDSEEEEEMRSVAGESVSLSAGDHHTKLRLGADGRPVSGLQRDRLIVRDGRMSDTEINMHLSTLLDHLKERTKHHLGYPYNLSFRSDNLVPFLQYSVNNLGDPFVASNYGVHSRDFEIAVLDFFANIYQIPRDQYWGYCTCSGTEGNLLGVLYGREKFMPKRDAVLYCSRDTHYSVPKAAAMYRMDLELIDSDETGEMIYADLEKKMLKHMDRPMLINVNVGTTVKGASDTVDEIIALLKKLNIPREKYYIHVDGALSGVILPFVSSRCENKRISFDKPIDSVSVSGHKMLGTPMPSGIVITRLEHSKRWASDVEYLNSTDTTIMGSRNGQAAIAMWVALQRKGIDGLRADVVQCLDNAKYLKELLDKSVSSPG
jgi:histidine decarboxylase